MWISSDQVNMIQLWSNDKKGFENRTELKDECPDVLEEVNGPVLGLDGHEEGIGPPQDGILQIFHGVVR